jgi:hypothetical protein
MDARMEWTFFVVSLRPEHNLSGYEFEFYFEGGSATSQDKLSIAKGSDLPSPSHKHGVKVKYIMGCSACFTSLPESLRTPQPPSSPSTSFNQAQHLFEQRAGWPPPPPLPNHNQQSKEQYSPTSLRKPVMRVRRHMKSSPKLSLPILQVIPPRISCLKIRLLR